MPKNAASMSAGSAITTRIKPQLTAAENLRFCAASTASSADVEAALAGVGLSAAAELPGRYLSAGQRKRLALARLALCNRPLWLLDEPLAALDAARTRAGRGHDRCALRQRRHRHRRNPRTARHRLRAADDWGRHEPLSSRCLRRDIRLATRSGGSAMLALAFFAGVAALVPFGVGADLALLGRIAGGVIWIAAVLAALLALDRLFQADFEDGSLDLIALSPLSLEAVAPAKIAAHWLTTGLPLTLLSPVLALLFNIPPQGYAPLVLSLADRHAGGQRGGRGGRGADAVRAPRRAACCRCWSCRCCRRW